MRNEKRKVKNEKRKMKNEKYEQLTHEQLKFREHTERAANFIKIDLFRSAREEFKVALEYQPGDGECLKQIDAMNANIARDRKTVLIIAPLVILLIVAVALLV
jgi:malic enzyme